MLGWHPRAQHDALIMQHSSTLPEMTQTSKTAEERGNVHRQERERETLPTLAVVESQRRPNSVCNCCSGWLLPSKQFSTGLLLLRLNQVDLLNVIFFLPSHRQEKNICWKAVAARFSFCLSCIRSLFMFYIIFFFSFSFHFPVSQRGMRTDKHHALICLSMSIHGGPQGSRMPHSCCRQDSTQGTSQHPFGKTWQTLQRAAGWFFFPCFFIFSPKITSTRGLFCFIVFWSASMCRNRPYRTSFRFSLRFIL